MVHALEKIRRLLKPDGYLIDIHPIREAPFIKVFCGSDLLFAEADPGHDYDDDIRHAEESLTEMLRRDLYFVEREDEYELITSASSAAELKEYWVKYGAFDDTPKDEAMTAQKDAMYARADEIRRSNNIGEINYHERAHITKLKPVAD